MCFCKIFALTLTGCFEESGVLPDSCAVCLSMLDTAGIKNEKMLTSVLQVVRENMEKGVQTLEAKPMLKPLKRQRMETEAKQEDTVKQEENKVKTEPAVKISVKQEPQECPDDQPKIETASPPVASVEQEYVMGKNELIALHQLQVLPRGTFKKKFPIECCFCNTVFEGRNRAKVFQHTSGMEHRRRWRKGVTKSMENKDKENNGAKDDCPHGVGKCEGVRLNGEVGRQTRLGSDLRSCWDVYAQYASLDPGPSGQFFLKSCLKVFHSFSIILIQRFKGLKKHQDKMLSMGDAESKHGRQLMCHIVLFVFRAQAF